MIRFRICNLGAGTYMAQSYADPLMDKYWNLRHLLLDIAHLGRDEFVRVADIMGIKFSKGENWPHEMFDTLYDDVMHTIQGGEKGRYSELIKAIIQTRGADWDACRCKQLWSTG